MPRSATPTPAEKHRRKLKELRRLLQSEPRRHATPDGDAATFWQRLVGQIGLSSQLVDCLMATGSGGGLVALRLCSQACRLGGELVVVDPSATFFPPTAVAWGVDAERLLVIRPRCDVDALAAAETALRSPAVAGVWASLGAIPDRAFRRLLLATEAGRSFATLVRPVGFLAQPSWGDLQLRFSAVPSPNDEESSFCVGVEQTRNRHGPAGGDVLLSVDWKSGRIEELPREAHARNPSQDTLRVAPGLARATRSA